MIRKLADNEILYHDSDVVAVYKRQGLFVHRTALDDADEFLMQNVRDTIGQMVYPVHRLDRPTAGIVLFALSSESAASLCNDFRYNTIDKTYYATVRGWCDDCGVIDHSLYNERKTKRLDAVTHYETVERYEFPLPLNGFETVRYCRVKVVPKSGRMHQIRRHMKHISHPIVGDTTYGKRIHNELFQKHFNLSSLQLCATEISFPHPLHREKIVVSLPCSLQLSTPFLINK